VTISRSPADHKSDPGSRFSDKVDLENLSTWQYNPALREGKSGMAYFHCLQLIDNEVVGFYLTLCISYDCFLMHIGICGNITLVAIISKVQK
jgi:hypothetical protein